MTYSNDSTSSSASAQSGPHAPVQPHQNSGLARLVGSFYAGRGLSKSVWDTVDLAYRHLKNMRGSASGLFAARGPSSGPTVAQTEARAKQSDKILVRVLAKQRRYEEITRMAETTQHDEIANLAMVRLIQSEEDNVDLIVHLARGKSKAASVALFGLLNTGYVDLAKQIFVERMADGSLCELAREGLTTAFTLLAFAGRLDEKTGLNFCRAYFDPIFASVSGNPREMLRFFGEILGDPEPLEGRCVPVPCATIPREIKMMVVSLLSACEPAARERCLAYAAAEDDEEVARLATNLLIAFWDSPEGRVPVNIVPFAMLNLGLLFHLCNMSASFKWPESVDFDYFEAEANRLQYELENFDPAGPEIKRRALEMERDGLAREVDVVIERRLRCLQGLVNGICAMLNIPNPILEIGQGSFMAAYTIGRGKIRVASRLFLDDAPLSIDLMSTLLHEIGHMEQDMLVIRLMADDLGLIFGQHSKLLRPLMERYAHAIGYAPDPMFLLGVLRLRNDQPLNQIDRVRATKLIDASYDTENGHQTGKLIEARIDFLSKSQDALLAGECDRQLLGCLADRRAVEAIFKQGQIPAVVLDEIADCQTEFVHVMHDVLAARYHDVSFIRPSTTRNNQAILPMVVIAGRRYTLIELAANLLETIDHEPLLWIVERIKHLLVEVLKEEQEILHSRLVDIRREGYHEEEAYIISDRAEVIVKALRKGWYRAT